MIGSSHSMPLDGRWAEVNTTRPLCCTCTALSFSTLHIEESSLGLDLQVQSTASHAIECKPKTMVLLEIRCIIALREYASLQKVLLMSKGTKGPLS